MNFELLVSMNVEGSTCYKGRGQAENGLDFVPPSLFMEGLYTEEAAAPQVACHKLVCFE